MSEIKIKIKEHSIRLEDWRQSSTYPNHHYRNSKEYEALSITLFLSKNNFYQIHFAGIFKELSIIYHEMWDQSFICFDLEKAKQHVDTFLIKYDKLKIFI